MFSTNSAVVAQPVSVNGLEIRPMTKLDSDFAGRAAVDCFLSKFETAVGKDKIEFARQGCANEMATRGEGGYDDIYIAWYEGRRVGFLTLKFSDTKRPNGDADFPGIGCCGLLRLCCMEMSLGQQDVKKGQCYVETLAVDASMRGKGVGKTLLDFADNTARARGCHTIFLGVAETNRARNLYARQGYINRERIDGCCCTTCSVGERYFYEMEKKL